MNSHREETAPPSCLGSARGIRRTIPQWDLLAKVPQVDRLHVLGVSSCRREGEESGWSKSTPLRLLQREKKRVIFLASFSDPPLNKLFLVVSEEKVAGVSKDNGCHGFQG
jgi:hypothetical protein